MLTPHGTVTPEILAEIAVPADDRFAMAITQTSPKGKWHRVDGGCDNRTTSPRRRARDVASPSEPTHNAVGFDLTALCRNCPSPLTPAARHVLGAALAVHEFRAWEKAWTSAVEAGPVAWLDHARCLTSIPAAARLDRDLAAPLRADPTWADAVTSLDQSRRRLHARAEKVVARYAAAAPRRTVDAAIDAAVSSVEPEAATESAKVATIAYARHETGPTSWLDPAPPPRPDLWSLVHRAWSTHRRAQPVRTEDDDILAAAVSTHVDRHLPPTLSVHDLNALPCLPGDTPRDGECLHQWAARTFTAYRHSLVTSWLGRLDSELDGRLGSAQTNDPLTHAVLTRDWPPIADKDTDRAHLSAYPVLARITPEDFHERHRRYANAGPGRHVSAREAIVALAVPAWQAEALSDFRQAPLPTPLAASTPVCHEKPSKARASAVEVARTLLHEAGFALVPDDAHHLAATITTVPLVVRRERDEHPLTDVPAYYEDPRPLRQGATARTYGGSPRDWDEYEAFDAIGRPRAMFVPGHDQTVLLAMAARRAPIPAEVAMVTAADGPLINLNAYVMGCDPEADTIDLRPAGFDDTVTVPLAAVATVMTAHTDRFGRLSR